MRKREVFLYRRTVRVILNTKLSQLTFRKLKEGVVQWGGRAENEGQLVELVGKPKF